MKQPMIMLGRRSQRVLDALRKEVLEGRFQHGDKLPTEQQLCERFKVSRTTVRRSLQHLSRQGLVRSRRGSGVYVCGRPERPAALRSIALMYNFDGDDLTCIQDYALAQNYLICPFSQRRRHWDITAERRFLDLVASEHHQGLLAFCSPLEPRNEDCLARIAAAGIPVIHVEHYRKELPDQNYILPDYRRAGHMATIDLMLAGYSQIRYAGVNLSGPYSQLLRQGVADALAEHGNGMTCDGLTIHIPSGFTRDQASTSDLVERLDPGASTGIVCESSGIAQLIRDTLLDAGFRVPGQVGIIGAELVGPQRSGDAVDLLRFDRLAILQEAIDAVTQVAVGRVRKLVAPVIVRHGSVRQCSIEHDIADRTPVDKRTSSPLT